MYVDMYDSRHLHFSSFAGPPFKTKGTKKEGPFFRQSIKRFNSIHNNHIHGGVFKSCTWG